MYQLTRLIHADNLQKKSSFSPFSRKYFNTTSVNSNDFTVQTFSETCVQCVRHSNPRHTANEVSIIRCCDRWSAVAVRATPARLTASTDQRCQTSWRSRLAPSWLARKWRNPLALNPGCWSTMSDSMQATFSTFSCVSTKAITGLCLFVCPRGNSKTNDLKVFTLCFYMEPWDRLYDINLSPFHISQTINTHFIDYVKCPCSVLA